MDPHKELVDKVIAHVIDAFADIPNPIDRAKATGTMLEAVPVLHSRIRETRQAAVLELRESLSLADVGEALGISRSRVQQISKGHTGSKRAAEE